MTSRKLFIFLSGVLALIALLSAFRILLESGYRSSSLSYPILIFLGAHVFVYYIRLKVKKRGGWISFIPSYPFALISLFLLYQWIKQKAYLPCPEGAFCEDSLSPFLFIATSITIFSALYSLAFELMYARKRAVKVEQDIVELEKEQMTSTSPEPLIESFSPIKRFFRTKLGSVLILFVGGIILFGAVYAVFGLIALIFKNVLSNLDSWISTLVYAIALVGLYVFMARKKILESIKATFMTTPIIIWMASCSQIGRMIDSTLTGVLLSFVLPTLAFVYVFIKKKAWFYYLAIIISAMFGVFLTL